MSRHALPVVITKGFIIGPVIYRNVKQGPIWYKRVAAGEGGSCSVIAHHKKWSSGHNFNHHRKTGFYEYSTVGQTWTLISFGKLGL